MVAVVPRGWPGVGVGGGGDFATAAIVGTVHTTFPLTMSLADELLNDLDGLSDDGGPSETEESNEAGPRGGSGGMGPPALPRKRAHDDAGESGDDSDEEMAAAPDGVVGDESKLADGTSAVGFVAAGGVKPAEELDREEVEGMNLKTVDDVETVVKLQKSKRLLEALKVIAEAGHCSMSLGAHDGSAENRPLYSSPHRHL